MCSTHESRLSSETGRDGHPCPVPCLPRPVRVHQRRGQERELDAEQTGVPEERARTVAALYRSIGEHDDNSGDPGAARTL